MTKIDEQRPQFNPSFVPNWPVAPSSTGALPGKQLLRPANYPAPGVGSYRQPALRRPLWGALHSTVLNTSLVAASIAQLPLGLVLLFVLAANSGPPVLLFLPLLAMVLLQTRSRTELSATDWGLVQRSPQKWAVAWQDIDRIEIQPGGASALWGQQQPRVVIHDQGRAMGRPHRLGPHQLSSRIQLDQVDALIAMAERKGVPVWMPNQLLGPIRARPELEAGPPSQ